MIRLKGANFEPSRNLNYLRRSEPYSGPADPAADRDQRRRVDGHSRPSGRPQPRRLPARPGRLISFKCPRGNE